MPMIRGSTPAWAYPTSLPRGVRPLLVTNDSDASTTAAAASLMPDALPAVTVPSFANAGFSLAMSSRLTPGRICSSVSTTVMLPLLPGISTGRICSLKYPAAVAAAARRWLSAASSSWSARDTLKSAATFSAVTPMWQASNGSLSAPTMGSSAVPSPIRWPQRMPGSQ